MLSYMVMLVYFPGTDYFTECTKRNTCFWKVFIKW